MKVRTYVQKSNPTFCFVDHSDMRRSMVSLSRVVEYLCLASPGPSRIITQSPITRRAFEREHRPKRRAKAIGELKEPGAAAALGNQ